MDQPEWMEFIAPNAVFNNFTSEFQYDDGGPDFDWCIKNHPYPPDLGVKFLDSLSAESELDGSDLQLREVELNSLKCEQKFAFNCLMDTLYKFIENPATYEATTHGHLW